MLVASIVSFIVDELHKLPGGVVYLLVGLLVFGEAALFFGFVLPGETSVIVAGVIASQGNVNIVVLCILVVAAAIIGDSVGFEIGVRYGERILRLGIFDRRRAAIDRALDGLQRRGPLYVFVGRFTAFLRAVMPGLAGMSRMHYRRFLVANALGGLVWGITFTLLGYFAGNALSSVEKYAGWATSGLLVLFVAAFVTLHFRRKRRERLEDEKWLAAHGGAEGPSDLNGEATPEA